MRTLLVIAAVVALALSPSCACGNANACVDDPNSSAACPPLEGSYQMAYGQETDSSGCGANLPPAVQPNPLILTRLGSVVRSVVNGVQYSGQVTDTFDWTLNGSNGLDPDAGEMILAVHGRYIPGTGDGGLGATIQGTWDTTLTDSDCNRSSPFTGTKQ